MADGSFARSHDNLVNRWKENFHNVLHYPEPTVKVYTLDIAPLRSESPPQKRSGMTCVFSRDFTVLPAHPHVHPQSVRAIPAFAFPAITGTHLPTPEGWKVE